LCIKLNCGTSVCAQVKRRMYSLTSKVAGIIATVCWTFWPMLNPLKRSIPRRRRTATISRVHHVSEFVYTTILEFIYHIVWAPANSSVQDFSTFSGSIFPGFRCPLKTWFINSMLEGHPISGASPAEFVCTYLVLRPPSCAFTHPTFFVPILGPLGQVWHTYFVYNSDF